MDGRVDEGVAGALVDSTLMVSRSSIAASGRTSARAEAPGLQSAYVREEHLFAGLRWRLTEVTREDTGDHPRANGLVIVYLGPDWILEQRQPDAAPTALSSRGNQLSLPVC